MVTHASQQYNTAPPIDPVRFIERSDFTNCYLFYWIRWNFMMFLRFILLPERGNGYYLFLRVGVEPTTDKFTVSYINKTTNISK